MKKRTKQEKIELFIKILIVVLAFSVYFTWSCSQKYDAGPDEYMKYDICKFISERGTLPHGGDEAVRNPIWGISYGFTPIIAYIICAIFMRIAMIFTQNEFAIVVAARFTSVLFNTLTVIMLLKISEKLFKGVFKYLFVIIIAFLPQFAFLGSYINNDSMAIFTIILIIYSWIIGIENKWNIKSCIMLGISLRIMCSFIL